MGPSSDPCPDRGQGFTTLLGLQHWDGFGLGLGSGIQGMGFGIGAWDNLPSEQGDEVNAGEVGGGGCGGVGGGTTWQIGGGEGVVGWGLFWVAGSIHFHSGQKSQAIGPTFFSFWFFGEGLIFWWVKLLRVFNVFLFWDVNVVGVIIG